MAVSQALVAGRYRLAEPVGVGGMGRVWMARDEMLDRDVAVKEFIPPEWMTDAERDRLRTRTLREARSAARLNHPHVVRIYDVVHAEDQPWIVMEYVASRSLHQVIQSDGPLAPDRAARIGLAVLDALTAAHDAGVLHRDVKPHNVLIGHDGRVVLTDFGLATFVDDGAVTGPGLIVGSPQYVSPERARDGASTVESDLWSFGATLYAAVEGRSPYARDTAMATLTALATEPPDPPVLAGPLAPVLTGLLRREPSARITAVEAYAGLDRVVYGDPDQTPARPGIPAPRRPADPSAAAPPTRREPTPHAAPRPTPAPGDGAPTPALRDGASAPALSGGVFARPGGGATDRPGTPGGRLGDGSGAGLGAAVAAALPGAVGIHDRAAFGIAPVPSAPGHVGAAPRRRYRLMVAGVALIAVLGGGGLAVGWLTQRGDRPAAPPVAGAPSAGVASPGGSPSVTTLAGTGGFSPVACGVSDPAVRSGAPLPRTPLPGARPRLPGGFALPPRWSYHADGSGFFIAVPDGWTYRRVGATLCFRDPGGTRTLSLDTARRPSADPVAACRTEARRLAAAGLLPGYAEVGIERVPYVPKAADWEYRYDGRDGIRLHATTRWFAAGGRAYALGWVTPEFDWQTNRSLLTMIEASFTAAGT